MKTTSVLTSDEGSSEKCFLIKAQFVVCKTGVGMAKAGGKLTAFIQTMTNDATGSRVGSRQFKNVKHYKIVWDSLTK